MNYHTQTCYNYQIVGMFQWIDIEVIGRMVPPRSALIAMLLLRSKDIQQSVGRRLRVKISSSIACKSTHSKKDRLQ